MVWLTASDGPAYCRHGHPCRAARLPARAVRGQAAPADVRRECRGLDDRPGLLPVGLARGLRPGACGHPMAGGPPGCTGRAGRRFYPTARPAGRPAGRRRAVHGSADRPVAGGRAGPCRRGSVHRPGDCHADRPAVADRCRRADCGSRRRPLVRREQRRQPDRPARLPDPGRTEPRSRRPGSSMGDRLCGLRRARRGRGRGRPASSAAACCGDDAPSDLRDRARSDSAVGPDPPKLDRPGRDPGCAGGRHDRLPLDRCRRRAAAVGHPTCGVPGHVHPRLRRSPPDRPARSRMSCCHRSRSEW